MTFVEFIKTRRITRNARGDFLRDAQADIRGGGFPAKVTSLRGLQTYLSKSGACDGAVEAGRKLWQEYQTSNKGDQ